jgi:hypothetical protein
MGQVSTAVQSLKSILEDQQHQVNDLRKSLSDRTPVIPNIIIQNPLQTTTTMATPQFIPQQSQPQQQQLQTVVIEKQVMQQMKQHSSGFTKTEKSVISSTSNKWNMLPTLTNEERKVEEPKTNESQELKNLEVLDFNPVVVVKEKPAVVVETKKPPVEQPKPFMKPASPPPMKRIEESNTVTITFPFDLNPLLRSVIRKNQKNSTGLTITMRKDMNDSDEVIAHLRGHIASQVRLFLSFFFCKLKVIVVALTCFFLCF